MSKYFFLIIALLFVVNSKEAQAQKSPEYLRTKDWSIKALNEENLELRTTAVFYNPNKIKIKLKNVDLNLFLNDQFIGKIVQSEIVKIKGKSHFDIPLELAFSLKESDINILSSLISLLTNQNVLLKMNGHIKANVLCLPFKVKIEDTQEFSIKDIF